MIDNKRPIKWEEDGYTVTRTTAWSGPGCHEGCGVLLYEKDGKIEKIEGDPLHPYNQGRLCPRCAAFTEVIYHPDRITTPMKRVGERGEGKFEEISWDEAYEIIRTELTKVFDQYGGKSFWTMLGTGRDLMWQPYRLTFGMGSPNTGGGLSGSSCYIPRVIAGFSVFGDVYPIMDASAQFEDRYDNPEWKPPECILMWGCNVVDSNPDGIFGGWTVECMKYGSKLITIDPRLTWLSAHSDVWLNIRPGTDGALALGMLHIIIEEDLYDHDFVENWTMGFDDLREACKDYAPERVAEICWIDEQRLLDATRMYAAARYGTIQLGLAVDQQVSGLAAAQAIMYLMCITGNLDQPGGQVFCPAPFGLTAIRGDSWGLEEFVPEEIRAMTAGHQKYPILSFFLPVPGADDMIVQLETDEPYPIRAAWIQGNNQFAGCAQDSDRWLAACQKLEFVVACDLFITPTIVKLADVVLPVCTFAERDGIRALYFNLSTTNKAIEPVGDCRSDLTIDIEVGKMFNEQCWPWDDDMECLNALLQHSADSIGQETAYTMDDVSQEKGWLYPKWEYHKYEKGMMRPDGQPGFNTPSGKVEFNSNFMQAFSLPGTPEFAEPYRSPVSTPDIYEEYPIIMMTGARSKASFHSEHRQIPSLREIVPEPYVELNPEWCTENGIKEGDWVWIENDKDKIRMVAKPTNKIQPGMALAYHGWWMPEMKDRSQAFGYKDICVNRLIEMGHIGPSGFGADIKSVLVKIYKADEGPFDHLEMGKIVNEPSIG